MSAKGEATLCAEDYHVVNHACVPCPSGQSNMPGDDPTGHDTSCDTCKITTNQELRDYVDSCDSIVSHLWCIFNFVCVSLSFSKILIIEA